MYNADWRPDMVNENENAVEEQENVQYEVEDTSWTPPADEDKSESEETRTIARDSEEESSGELENYSENVQKRINQLTAKRKQALEEAEAAYAYAQSVKQQNEEMQKRLKDLDQGYMTEYGSRVETQTAEAKRMLKEGYDNGDVDKIAEAQDLMSRLAIEKERLRIQRARAEQQVQQPEQTQEVPQRQQQAPQRLDPKLKSWMDKNPWFGADAIMSAGAQAIHNQIVGVEGFDPQTDDYYREIDKRMRVEFPHKFQAQRQNAQAVAPASNGRSATKSGRKKTVELTPGQVNMAKKLGITLEQMAKEVAKMEARRA
tara:strand:+ start:1255 stop:2199 length:945 start_codon:yes stop_codon:yes gene_type:complete